MAPLDDSAKFQRDKRIRRDILRMLNNGRANEDNGYMAGRFLSDLQLNYAPRADRPENDDALLKLCRDLVNLDYVEQRDDREFKSQAFSLDYLSFRITAKGTALIAHGAPVDPMIEDDRIG